MNGYHLVLNVPRYYISFYADYSTQAGAVDNSKEIWDALSDKVKAEVLSPADDDTYFGVYDSTCSEGEWLWQPE